MNKLKLWEVFHYEPKTGELFRKYKTKDKGIVGTINKSGHVAVSFEGKTYYVHRIAYIMHYGSIPIGFDIDHINGNPQDNRIDNLRAVPHKVNRRNSKRNNNNTSGHTGIYAHGNKWVAKIKVDYKAVHLGIFKKLEDAVLARKEAEEKYGFHDNHGR